MSDVINFPGVTFNDIDADEMIKNIAEDMHFDSVVIVGWTEEEKLTLCSSMGATADIVYALEMGKKAIMDASEL